MRIPFYKYQGTGNDFVIVDNRYDVIDRYSEELIRKVCDRHFGVGADGMMLLQYRDGYNFEVRYYNADGSSGTCGNGLRCATHLAQKLGLIKTEGILFTEDGMHFVRLKDDKIYLSMRDVDQVYRCRQGDIVDTGAYHYVEWVKGIQTFDVAGRGKLLRSVPEFRRDGININFAELIGTFGRKKLFVRTYERGVEAETMSCGTGVVAAVLRASTDGFKIQRQVQTLGGELEVYFRKTGYTTFRDIFLAGPATMVYQGEIDVKLTDEA